MKGETIVSKELVEIWEALDNISKTLETTHELHKTMVDVLVRLDKNDT